MRKIKKQTFKKGMSVALASAIISTNILTPVSSVQAVLHQEETRLLNELGELLGENQEVVDVAEDFESKVEETEEHKEDEPSVSEDVNKEQEKEVEEGSSEIETPESDVVEGTLESESTENTEVTEDTVVSEEAEVLAELLINQVYGGGNKGETPFTHSFIEIYNPTDHEIDLSEYSVQYSTEDSDWVSTQLEGTLEAKGTYLIRCNEEVTSVARYILTEENTDLDWNQVIANKQYRVAIVKGEAVLEGFDFEEEGIIDLVGAVESGEGAAAAKPSKQKSVRRVNYQDTNDNAKDFVIVEYGDEKEAKSDLPPSLQSQFVETPEVPDEEETPQPPIESIPDTVTVTKIAGYVAGVANEDGGVAEIVKYNPVNNKFYVINGTESAIHVVSLDDLSQELITDKVIKLSDAVNVDGFVYGDVTSIEINTKLAIIVAAVQEADYTKNGKIVVMDYEGNVLKQFEAGVQPDMVKVSANGQYILVANEGEPREGLENGVDPKGSITIVDYLSGTAKNVYFDDATVMDENVIIRNKEGGALTDLEPEYIALSGDNKTAYVALQENNAIATIDVESGVVKSVKGLGFKDHSIAGNGLDAANNTKIEIEQLPILGVYMPDGIKCVTIGGVDYLVTANEGDATEWAEFENISKLGKVKSQLQVDSSLFKGMTEEEVNAKMDEILNTKKYDDLEVLTDLGTDAIYVLGGRSFTIWNAETLDVVFDSGDDFEQITASRNSEYFNVSNSNLKMDDRSRKKGPEPEDVTIGEINGQTYAFIGLERTGGVMMYDITNPTEATFVNYLSTRDYTQAISGDVAPEGLEFISADLSPTGKPLLLVANEVSGTVAINEIQIDVETTVDPIVDINIFHTNDIHGRVDENIGFAKFKRFMDIANGYTTAEGSLVLDAGDTFHGTSFATLESGESIAEVLNVVGYDAMSPGNHDFNYGQEQLTTLGKIAGVELLAGNVMDINDELKYGSIMVKEIEGVKVGVFGLATPETAYKTNPTNVEGLNFGTESEIIAETKLMVQALKDSGADVIVGLMHMGIDEDSVVKSTTIASQVDGIDLIVDGHSHSELGQYETVNGTVLTSTGEHFKNVGLVTIQYDTTKNEIVMLEPHQVSAADLEQVVADAEVKSVIDEIKEGQEGILKEVIGETSVTLDGERASVRNGHTNLGHLLTAAMLYETNADIALTNGGGIRASIAAGNITKGDVLTVLPFGNYIVTMEMTGQQIVDALNHGLVKGTGQFTHFTGIDVEAKLVQEEGQADRYEVVSVKLDGKALDMNKKYVIATNDFMAAGGDNYTMIAEGTLLNEFVALDEALISYIQKEKEAAIDKANQANVLTIVTGNVTTPEEEDDKDEEDDNSGSTGGDNNSNSTNNGNNTNTGNTVTVGGTTTSTNKPTTGLAAPTLGFGGLLVAVGSLFGIRHKRKNK